MSWFDKRFQTKPEVAEEEAAEPTAPRDTPIDVEPPQPKKRGWRKSRWSEEESKS